MFTTRVRRAAVALAGAGIAATAVMGLPQVASASPVAPTTGCADLLNGTPDAAQISYSMSADRSGPATMGDLVVGSRDKVYVFLQLEDPTPLPTGYKVEFWVDDCTLSPSVARDYRISPTAGGNGGWDIGGGNTSRTTAFSLNREADVWHTIVTRRTVEFADDPAPVVDTARFCIKARAGQCSAAPA